MRYLNYPNALVFDSIGYVWISTNNGLFQVKEEDLIAFADGKAGEVYMHYYDKSYGFATNEFNGGGFQSGLLAPNGNIYFASMKGLVIFNQNSITPILPNYPIYILDISLNGKKIENWKNLSFEKGFSNFRIKISTPFYGHPYNMNVSYRIKGLNNAWNRLNNNLELTIQTLRGGEYTLEYRMLNGFGKNNYSYRSIPFKVQPYFYERPLFYLTVFIFFLVGTYAQYRTLKLIRVKRKLEAEVHSRTITLNEIVLELRSRNEELSAKTEMLNNVYGVVTHDLVSPLRFLKRVALRLDGKFSEMSKAELKEHLESILHTTSHAETFVNDLLVWIKLKHTNGTVDIKWITPYEIIENDFQLFLWIANESGIKLKHEGPFDETPIKLPVELVHILVRNLLDNALKFTENGSITLKTKVIAPYLNIYIEDTGTGMAPDWVEQINARNIPYLLTTGQHMGLKIMFDILKTVQGDMYVQSELNKGTKVHLKIPVITMNIH
jgi:signal transduction histidine kinase